MKQHTPGPWSRLDRPENSFDDSRILTHISNGAHIICTLGTTRTDGSPNHSPNARLIASAPDLLSALEGLLKIAEKQLDQSAMHEGLLNCQALANTRETLCKAKREA
jgi:hypothetical protein